MDVGFSIVPRYENSSGDDAIVEDESIKPHNKASASPEQSTIDKYLPFETVEGKKATICNLSLFVLKALRSKGNKIKISVEKARRNIFVLLDSRQKYKASNKPALMNACRTLPGCLKNLSTIVLTSEKMLLSIQ